MTQDDPSQSAKLNDEQGADATLPERVESAASKSEVTTAQSVLPPSVSPKTLSSNPSEESEKNNKRCCEEISVRVVKDKTLTPFERRSLILAWVTLVVLVLTFIVFYLQLKESRTQTGIFRGQAERAARDASTQIGYAKQALADTKEAFRIDQRPYIFMADRDDNLTKAIYQNKDAATPNVPNGTSQLLVNVKYSNFGKSPAIDLQFSWDMEIGPHAKELAKIIPLKEAKTVMPTGKVDWFTAVTTARPDKEINDALSIDLGVVLIMRWQYSDTGGHRYETDICLEISRMGRGDIATNIPSSRTARSKTVLSNACLCLPPYYCLSLASKMSHFRRISSVAGCASAQVELLGCAKQERSSVVEQRPFTLLAAGSILPPLPAHNSALGDERFGKELPHAFETARKDGPPA